MKTLFTRKNVALPDRHANSIESDDPFRDIHRDDKNSSIALEVKNVHRSFGKTLALRGIDLQVDAGQKLALLGPNGAGKTTLVRAICGRLRIDQGEINLFGQPVTNPSTLARLGVVPQDLAIYGDLTTKENLNAFGRLHGLRGKTLTHRVDWALEWIGLEDRKNHLTKSFSGGMKRRVNIACGVLHRPRVLVLDEPTVGVDPQSRHRIFEMLDELSDTGTTIILTTHHLDEAQSRCDRIVIIDDGQVIADGGIVDLIEHTIGCERQVRLRIEGFLTASIPNLEWDASLELFVAAINEPAEELPQLLHRIRSCGGNVIDLEMHQPNLHDVFIHLTGRELRE
jgi:ABC-2 type transport system ATP-binding protein